MARLHSLDADGAPVGGDAGTNDAPLAHGKASAARRVADGRAASLPPVPQVFGDRVCSDGVSSDGVASATWY